MDVFSLAGRLVLEQACFAGDQ